MAWRGTAMRLVAGRYGCTRKASRFCGRDAKVNSAEVAGGARPGKQGQVTGAVTIGVPPEAASAAIAIIRRYMAQ